MSGTRPTRRLVVLFAAALAVGGAALAASTVRGSGVKRTETRNLSGFTGIAYSLPGDLELRIGTAEGVVIEADDNILPLIETRVSRGMLEIRPQRDQSIEPQHLKVVVTARSIDRLTVAGSANVTGEGLKGPTLKVDVGGSGAIDLSRLDVEQLTVSVGGSGNIKLAGTAKDMKLSLAGSGNIAAAGLQAEEARVSIAGSGVATVAAKSQLKVSIAGSGTVRYQGDPKVDRSIAGSGSVQRL